MNALKATYGRDFQLLAVPCNQFNLQEPGATGEEIYNGVRYVRPGNNFIPDTITFFRKMEVNGATEHPLYTFLKGGCPATRDTFADTSGLYYSPIRTSDIHWNYEKFLINKQGQPVYRYDPSSRVGDYQADIRQLLRQ